MEQNKVRKYLLYALGEILLVVIGILIALQVNNWNEERKDRFKEISILKEILVDIEVNKKDLEGDFRVQNDRLKITQSVIDHLVHNRPEYDSLSHHFRRTSTSLQFTPRMVGFERLKSEGVEIIQNEELRKFIILTFALNVESYVLEGREYEKFENPAIDMEPYLKKYLSIDTTKTNNVEWPEAELKFSTYGLKIRNYDSLLNDEEVIVVLHKTLFSRSTKIVSGKRLLANFNELQKMINDELRKT